MMAKILLLVTVAIFGVTRVNTQIRADARWCTINAQEYQKCTDLVKAIDERIKISDDYPSGIPPYDDLPQFKCVEANDPFACMSLVADRDADLVQFDPGMGYTAGEYYNLMPIIAEKYSTSLSDEEDISYKAVAVVLKSNRDIDFNNLVGKKACHTGVGRAAGWVHPISTLIETETMPIIECNVPVKSAASFFGDMCAPNALTRYYNPFGNNPVTVCENCKGYEEEFCTSNDPYAGYAGAFGCMASGDGQVAFVRDYTVYEYTKNSTMTPDDFELLCVDGTRAPVQNANACNWGEVASHIVMTSAMRDEELRNQFKQLLQLLSSDFGEGGVHQNLFQLFESTQYGKSNLMFTDASKKLVDVGERNTYYSWAGEEYRERLLLLNTCPLKQARFCVISRHEMSKCENMIMAFAAKNLKPDLNCILGTSTRDCMDKIKLGDADMITLDASDVFVAGKHYSLVPIAGEDYSGVETVEAQDESGWASPKYFSVGVARRTDSHLTIFNLKNRRSCHSGVMTAAGWIIPVDKLIETGQIHVDGCNAYFTVGQFFSKSCVPGVLDGTYNPYGTNPINLCEACSAGGRDRCMRNSEELYFGNSGSFRCLTEKGGDVAFAKHTTVRENTDGRNLAEWARNRRSDDYELLCNDGTRKDIDDWLDCNMGELPSNAVVTADFKSQMERDIFWTLLNYAQQFFASDSNEDFPMFVSMLDHKDLIFQDSTVRLVKVPPSKQGYAEYLGTDFMRAMERMEDIDCITSGTCVSASSNLIMLIVPLLIALKQWFSS